MRKVTNNYNHLKNLKLVDSSDKEIKDLEFLIGLDYYYQIVTGEIIREKNNEPIVLGSIFGWVLSGNFLDISRVHWNITTHIFRIDTVSKEFIETKDLNNPFEFDLYNIIDGREELYIIDENQHVLKTFQNTIKFENNRYIAKIPIKKVNDLIPDNYTVAKKRLNYLQKQLTKNKSLFTDYDKVIKQYLKEGIVEYVQNNYNKVTPGQVHFLPYGAVIRKNNETTNLRIAFDVPSKAKGEYCLNGILYSGPCLLPYLYDILLRF